MPIPSGPAHAKRTLLADDLYDQLLASIIDGTLEPDEALSEGMIADFAGVSRTPAREALDRLAAIGMVVVQPRRGTLVVPLDPTRTRHTVEALLPVVVEVARLSVRLATESERQSIVDRVRRLDDDALALVASDGVLDHLFTLLRNDRAVRVWAQLVPHLRRAWTMQPDSRPAGLGLEARDRLAASANAGDGDTASAVVRFWFDAQLQERGR